ncbi:hypothetical protein NECAME_11736 [Necator americanus]|uniref:Uncharacterized protein n=1 Tax=Necator americanus TaxID=51031 RepID=W2T472_NECAM|nr:hypothetical protein NECAME_11736 [Necator americanus]ETN76354.1 hypothetical protein NECAME_11736 [Necator americanus]
MGKLIGLGDKIYIVCILLLVVIVMTGSLTLIFIVRVTLLARKMFKSREIACRYQLTADNLRTVDEVIDQFKVITVNGKMCKQHKLKQLLLFQTLVGK